VPQETFGHLAAASILSTHKKHSWFDHCCPSLFL